MCNITEAIDAADKLNDKIVQLGNLKVYVSTKPLTEEEKKKNRKILYAGLT